MDKCAAVVTDVTLYRGSKTSAFTTDGDHGTESTSEYHSPFGVIHAVTAPM
jgi:hypothetical protein